MLRDSMLTQDTEPSNNANNIFDNLCNRKTLLHKQLVINDLLCIAGDNTRSVVHWIKHETWRRFCSALRLVILLAVCLQLVRVSSSSHILFL